jgi:hypothetical protein
LEEDPATALDLIDAARSHAQAADTSTARWDIMELEIHLYNANVAEARRCLKQIDERHRNNPEVAAEVYRMLYEVGLIQPGEITGQQPIPEVIDEFPADEVPIEESRIWTPGDELTTAPGQKKSRLWTPS